MTLRPLGVGSQILTHGDKMAGFFGEVTGIITADELRNIAGISQGNPLMHGDITWLKFSHTYKTLYVSKVPIQRSISWDYLHERDAVFGKMVEINGKVYLLRLIQGSNINPVPTTNNTSGINSEWDNLMVNYVNNWGGDINFLGLVAGEGGWAHCQEVHASNIANRIQRGGTTANISNLNYINSSNTGISYGWRPVLELLYEK